MGTAAPLSAIPGAQPCTMGGHSEVITNHGGGSIAHGKISIIYWGNWSGTHPFDAYWQSVANMPAFYNRLHEYGVSTGSFNRSFDLPGGATGNLTEDQLKAGIQQAIGSYVPTTSDVFIVHLPAGTFSLLDVQHMFGGHHSSFVLSGKVIPWGVVQFLSDPNEVEWRASHEAFEALTDPNVTTSCPGGNCGWVMGTGWFDASNNEVGDLCDVQTARIGGFTVQQFWSNAACRCVREEDLNNVDVLANGRFDHTIFRPSDHSWRASNFGTFWLLGNTQTQAFAGDYDGDGRTEFVAFSRGNPGTMNVLNIMSGTFISNSIGTSLSDFGVPGDYDGDGKTDLAVWTPVTGNWTIKRSSDGVTIVQQWGINTDIPIPADYDGDGRTDFAVFRTPSSWYILPANGNPSMYAGWNSVSGDIPVAGDFNGDGVADFAYWHPANGMWNVSYQNVPVAYSVQWGQFGDLPVGRDIDGDWITDLTVWRPSNGVWYTINSSTWGTSSVQWGGNGDTAIGKVLYP